MNEIELKSKCHWQFEKEWKYLEQSINQGRENNKLTLKKKENAMIDLLAIQQKVKQVKCIIYIHTKWVGYPAQSGLQALLTHECGFNFMISILFFLISNQILKKD
jgi:hypothetical protein